MEDEVVDPHLNLFRRYGLSFDSQEEENNVTHAFINTLRLSDPRVTRLVLTHLVQEIGSLAVDWSDIGWGLQRPPLSPSAFQNRVMLAISPDGYQRPGASDESGPEIKLAAQPNTEIAETDADSGVEGRGVPDAWIYTKRTSTLCISIEVKVRGGVDPLQIERHKRTHFRGEGITFENLDLRWRDLSRTLDDAYYEYPNQVLTEFLSFLSAEGLSATLCFDAATIHRAGGSLPEDCMLQVLDGVRSQLGLAEGEIVRAIRQVLVFRNFEAVGNIEMWLEGEPPHVNTYLSFGTAKAGAEYNRLRMPDQIERLLEGLAQEVVRRRFIEAARATGRPFFWTVYDRLIRAQYTDWTGRKHAEIEEILRTMDKAVPSDAATCFGEDQKIPCEELDRVRKGLGLLHRGGEIRSGPFQGYRLFARAYLGDLRVPAYDRSPSDVLPELVNQCVTWYRILRILSGED